MINNKTLKKEELPITICHKVGSVAHMLNIKEVKCAYCNTNFLKHIRNRIVNEKIKCPYCKEININTSSKKFTLKKYVPKVESNEKSTPIKKNEGKSRTSKKSKTT